MRGILTYHSIDSTGSVISISPGTFQRHLANLKKTRTQIKSVREIVEQRDGENSTAITFDDGFVNFREEAWPLLREHKLPVTLFVVTDRVGKNNAWPGTPDPRIPTLPLLDWDSIGKLSEEGVEIGSHSRTHRDLTTLSQNAIEEEMAGAAERIKDEIGVQPMIFAYPFGTVDELTLDTARRFYDIACTTEVRLLGGGEDWHRVPRLDSYYLRNPNWMRMWGKGVLQLYLGIRASLRQLRTRTGGDARGLTEKGR